MGDSFAFGFGVEKPDTVAEQLRQCLQGSSGETVRVINAASPGTGPLHYAQSVWRVAIPLKADTVIMVFYVGNDMENTHEPYLAFPYTLKNGFKILLPNAYLWASGWKYNRPLSAKAGEAETVGLDEWSDTKLQIWGNGRAWTPKP